jgi:hypothetical protein
VEIGTVEGNLIIGAQDQLTIFIACSNDLMTFETAVQQGRFDLSVSVHEDSEHLCYYLMVY